MLYKNLLISLILVLGSLIPNVIEIKSSELDQILDIGREKLLESDFKGALKEFNNVIKDGINVLILGKPNVGKSTILNGLLEEDKAIISDILLVLSF